MDDLISRQAAVDSLNDEYHGMISDESMKIYQIVEWLNTLPSAQPEHGRWIKMTGMMPPEYHGHYECSECQWHMKGTRSSWMKEEEYNYCPNCGCKMDGENNEID